MLLLRFVLHINSYLHLRFLLNMLSFSFLLYSSFPGFAFLCFSSYLSLLFAFLSLTFAWFSFVLLCFSLLLSLLLCFVLFLLFCCLFCFSFASIIIIITHKTNINKTKQYNNIRNYFGVVVILCWLAFKTKQLKTVVCYTY